MEPSDAELMGRYCDGDAAAFRVLYGRLAPRLLSYLLRMRRERARAEELLQLTFLKVHRARSAYVRGADPVPWIFAIARRNFLDDMRSRRRERVVVAPDGVPPEILVDATGIADHAATDVGPAQAQVRAALAALDRLPPILREAIVLTKLEGKSIAEAAALLGTTPGAMKVRAHRGYQALRKELADAADVP